MKNFDVHDAFAVTPAGARQKFLTAAKASGLPVFSYAHPEACGPGGETLYTDVAWEGCAASPLVEIVTAGIHGIEGMAGSAILVHSINTRPGLPPDTSRVYVHALNTHGFAWERRVDENNVDLNRNFIDWKSPPPADHPFTGKINDILMSRHGKWPLLKIAGFILRHGMPEAKNALSQGQYTNPDGLFHGGVKPAWSNTLWHQIIADYARSAEHIIHIDLHTGLGPYGHGEIIVPESRAHASYKRAQEIWGRVTSTVDGTSSSSRVNGDMSNAFKKAAAHAGVTSVTLEFGTLSPLKVLRALTADNAAYALGKGGPETEKARQQMRAAFYPDDSKWQKMVIGRSEQVIQQAREGLIRIAAGQINPR